MAAEFLTTVGDVTQLDRKGLLTGKHLMGHAFERVAMVGRSNVGKSSLINALLGAKLARVSNQPGKTRCIHFYLWRDTKRIVADLPGYGYARASHDDRDKWAAFINEYLRRDEGLERALVLLDGRHGPTKLDVEAIKFLSFESVPVTFIFTKADQIKNQSERARRKKEASAALLALGYDPTLAHWVSAHTGLGIRELASELSAR